MKIKFIESNTLRNKPNQDQLGFGKFFADYMFEMDYSSEKGWFNPTIRPYGPLSLDPSSMILHYGQSVFEGLKAYLNKENEIILFRPLNNIKRLNKSNERLCIPQINEENVMQAIIETVKANKDWIPSKEGTSLYIRPFVFATDACIGVRSSDTYKFMIIVSPVGAYYPNGFNPIKINVEDYYVRAVAGGMGEAKTAGNYAASIKAQTEAKKKGFDQVLWLDGVHHKFIEEVGTMNVFFKIKNEILTPNLNGSFLAGVTRDSVIKLLADIGYKVSERKVSMDEVLYANSKGELEEVFGTGTAAVISPVSEMWFKEKKILINDGRVGDITLKVYEELIKIQTGKAIDKYNWTVKI